MKVEGYGDLVTKLIQPGKNKTLDTENFGNTITDFINDVNKSQTESHQSVENFVSGNGVELHEVMIAGAKAKTNLELLMEIRNKAIDMYKELTRMPV